MICPARAVPAAIAALGPALLSSACGRGLARFASLLPDAATGHVFELRLDGPAGAADYSVALLPGHGIERMRQQALARPDLLGQTASLLTASAMPPAAAGVLWLEFDLDSDGSAGLPSFFVAPATGPVDADGTVALARGLAEALGRDMPQAAFERLLAQLPDGAHLRQIGIMAGRNERGPASLRLVIEGLAAAAIPSLLNRVAWPGAAARARSLAATAASLAQDGPVRLDLDLGQALLPGLGIEIPAVSRREMTDLVAGLAGAGMASPAKAAALGQLAPRRTIGELDGATFPTLLDFGLNHVKLAVARDGVGPDIAKAYFSLVATPNFAAAGTMRH
ncbi:hypothetical protein [Tropicimonas sp. IMCC34043]|uniref:hypothetical protein n=1 Tax=Tropicimonas sp. IMCC34043 TaxID=2248760 RepID=UPI000E271D73|nr:hypothetical protein [Tropicimonas sp. IMCC34043]